MQGAIVSKPAPSEDNFEMKATKAMGTMEEGDAVFGNVAETTSYLNLSMWIGAYWWHDKHRPRKPKSSNRVSPQHTIEKDGNSTETDSSDSTLAPYEDIVGST